MRIICAASASVAPAAQPRLRSSGSSSLMADAPERRPYMAAGAGQASLSVLTIGAHGPRALFLASSAGFSCRPGPVRPRSGRRCAPGQRDTAAALRRRRAAPRIAAGAACCRAAVSPTRAGQAREAVGFFDGLGARSDNTCQMQSELASRARQGRPGSPCGRASSRASAWCGFTSARSAQGGVRQSPRRRMSIAAMGGCCRWCTFFRRCRRPPYAGASRHPKVVTAAGGGA